jgi:hypothetical protein
MPLAGTSFKDEIWLASEQGESGVLGGGVEPDKTAPLPPDGREFGGGR